MIIAIKLDLTSYIFLQKTFVVFVLQGEVLELIMQVFFEIVDKFWENLFLGGVDGLKEKNLNLADDLIEIDFVIEKGHHCLVGRVFVVVVDN